jgi:hypothetical protein
MATPSLRLVVLLFWALWLTIVTASNVTNALRVAGALPTSFAFASANFELIEASTAIYQATRGVVWALFLGVIAWEAAAAGLFWRATIAVWRQRTGAGVATAAAPLAPAFAAALGLFAAFMLADELLIAYPLQATHMRVFIALGVSWLVVRPSAAP